jgi:serine/threonine protein kinase
MLGAYRLEKLLGEGSMGNVYLASDEAHNRQVAIKILHPACTVGSAGKRHLKRFQREARLTTLLDHPNIVKTYENGEQDGMFYLVMEFVSGASLLDLIQQQPLPPEQTLYIAEQVALALKAAHGLGVIHRDVKPGNILVLADNRIKLSDFGLARLAGVTSSVSQAGQIIGTVFYLSPEQAIGSPRIDHRADFYSLGVTLFQALSGQLPYTGSTPLQVLQQHISAPIPKLRDLRSTVSPQLESLVAKLMNKKPAHRFSDSDELLAAIHQCHQGSAGVITNDMRRRMHSIWRGFAGSRRHMRFSSVVVLAFFFGIVLFILAGRQMSLRNKKETSPTSVQSNHQPLAPLTAPLIQPVLPQHPTSDRVDDSDSAKHLGQQQGWFGESMPGGMNKLSQPGEYLWSQDEAVMVYVAAGEFWMGDVRGRPDERMLRKIEIAAFYLDKYEVTQQQYGRFCSATGHEQPPAPEWPATPQHPVVQVSWEDSVSYARWAQKRLPTEAEWEKAARGGFKVPDWQQDPPTSVLVSNPYPRRAYPWGNEQPYYDGQFYCNWVAYDRWQQRGDDGYTYTAPVGSFARGASPYHCHDMSGNVWEWCEDVYQENFYTQNAQADPVNRGNSTSVERVLRGGSWFNFAEGCRTSRRHHAPYHSRLPWVGIRLAK